MPEAYKMGAVPLCVCPATVGAVGRTRFDYSISRLHHNENPLKTSPNVVMLFDAPAIFTPSRLG